MRKSSEKVCTFREGKLPANWTSATIEDLIGNGIFTDGDWVETKDQDPNGEVRLTQLADVGDGKFRNMSARFLTLKRAQELKCTFLQPDDVLIARMPQPIGRACIFPGDSKLCVTAVDVCIVRPGTSGVDRRWLMHSLNSPAVRYTVSSLQSGSTRQRVSRRNLAMVELPVPPLIEQRRIVAAIEEQFSRLDAGVAALDRTRTTLKRYRAAVLKAAVEGRLTEAWREENPDVEPASELLERVLKQRRERWEKDQLAAFETKGKKPPKNWRSKYRKPASPSTEDLPELPERWCWTSIEQLGNVIGGLTKNQKRASHPLKLPYLRVANVYADELRLDDVEEIGVGENELDRVLLKTGDLLVVEGNGSPDQIGRVALWNGSIDRCVHQNHLIKVRFVVRALGKQVLHWLLSANGRERIKRVASSTSGLYTLSISKVQDLPVPLLPLAEQEQIVAEVERRLSILKEVEAEVEANLKRATRLRQAILKRAFEGKLVPQNPTDEPASELLARIRIERERSGPAKRRKKIPARDETAEAQAGLF